MMEKTQKTITKETKTVGAVRERERESNRLEKVAQICDAKNKKILVRFLVVDNRNIEENNKIKRIDCLAKVKNRNLYKQNVYIEFLQNSLSFLRVKHNTSLCERKEIKDKYA